MNLFQHLKTRLTPQLYTRINLGSDSKPYPKFGCVLLAYLIAQFFPVRYWCNIALWSTHFSALFSDPISQNKNPRLLTRANHQNRLLSLLTRTGKPFPIHVRNVGLNELEGASKIIFCTVHLPLVKVAIRSILENHIPINGAIVGIPLKNDQFAVYGINDKINALTRNPYVLLKAKRILNDNGNIVLMVDNSSGEYYSPNIMHLCGMVGARMIFFYSELLSDGTIKNTFANPPNPHCRNEEEVNENMTFVKQSTAEILQRYKSRS